ncbi:MAG: c-type cytochrome biogenesis protein CcmI, partial [Sutterellaceae bacterium]|nr:c-type cytochrome biogenesis protein CcmI [Sutterellaceae bacterium]
QKRVSDLPAKFTLDSTMRLPGGMGGMETMSRVVVGARVSKSGNLMPQAGDLEGDTPAVAVGSANLVVKISKKLEP